MQVRSLGQEDPLEEGMAIHSSNSCFGESHEQRSLTGYSPWDCKDSDTTEQLSMHACSAYQVLLIILLVVIHL